MFHLSSTLSRMLETAGVDRVALNRAVGARIRRGERHMMERDHFPRLIREATGVNVIRISRRNRRLLIETDDRGVRYAERGVSDRTILLPEVLPEIAKTGTVGMPFGRVARIGALDPFVTDQVVAGYEDPWEGATLIRLTGLSVAFNP